jgi:RNA polymerase sigma-70 factor, ECF subfamily
LSDSETTGGTTASLVGRARQGDSAALEVLLRRYLAPLRQWASHRLPHYARDLMDTDDLVQEAVIRTIRRLDTYEPQGSGSFLAYLRRAILNRVGDEIRRAQMRETKEDFVRGELRPAASPLEEAIGREAVDRYERALAALDPDAQEAVIARIELGLSYAEIAESVGKPSPDAARMSVNRAIRRLAEAMQELRDDA